MFRAGTRIILRSIRNVSGSTCAPIFGNGLVFERTSPCLCIWTRRPVQSMRCFTTPCEEPSTDEQKSKNIERRGRPRKTSAPRSGSKERSKENTSKGRGRPSKSSAPSTKALREEEEAEEKLVASSTKKSKGAEKAKKEKIEKSPEILDYLKTLQVRMSKFHNDIRVLTKSTATYLVKKMMVNDETIVFEGYPGNGFVTDVLLEAGVKEIRLFEPNKTYCKKLMKKYQNHDGIKVFDIDLIWIRMMHEEQPGLLNRYLGEIPHKQWHDDPVFKLFVPLSYRSDKDFLRKLPMQIMTRHGIFSHGRVEIYAFITGQEYDDLSRSPLRGGGKNRGSAIMSNLFYNVSHLGSLPWSKHFENYAINPKKQKDADMAHLVCITPKRDLFDDMTVLNWVQFNYFVSQIMYRKRQFLIPFLEKWFPDCGVDLIRQGVPYFFRNGDLTPRGILALFKYLKSLPQYKGSTFYEAAMALAPRSLTDCFDEEHTSSSDNPNPPNLAIELIIDREKS